MNNLSPIGTTPPSDAHRSLRRRAFTLIELLVVIAIIGVLASLTVGLSSLAITKSKISRVKTELSQLELAINDYKNTLGYYPPDNLKLFQNDAILVDPARNQLFYELSGSVYDPQTGLYRPLAGGESFLAAAVEPIFSREGFFNSALSEEGTKNFLAGRNAGNWGSLRSSPGIFYLRTPVDWPPNSPYQPPIPGETLNPWHYVSSNPTNNPGTFDLWAEVVIGDELITIGNWSDEESP